MNRKFRIDLCHPPHLRRARYTWAVAGTGDDYSLNDTRASLDWMPQLRQAIQ